MSTSPTVSVPSTEPISLLVEQFTDRWLCELLVERRQVAFDLSDRILLTDDTDEGQRLLDKLQSVVEDIELIHGMLAASPLVSR